MTVRPVKVYNAREELRRAIAAQDMERIQAAWDRIQDWLDHPMALPLSMGGNDDVNQISGIPRQEPR